MRDSSFQENYERLQLSDRSSGHQEREETMEFEKLKEIIADVLNTDPASITPETRFVDDLGADSLDVFQIIMGIENYFEITIDDFQAEKIQTVQDAAEEIRNSLK